MPLVGGAEPNETEIQGVIRFTARPHGDHRGSLAEIYRREWLGPEAPDVVQANLSVSRPGVLRGLHVHREQSDVWCPVSGALYVGLFDLRPSSGTFRKRAELRIGADEDRGCLVIPPGVAHGFYAETPVQLLYLVDRPYSGGDELGLAWDDPDVGIAWPSREPLLSERDRSNPGLGELLELLRP
jgi:dTDP-4-dehydrorhamnose 3,5-epimerase